VGFRGFLQLSLPIPTLFPIKMRKPVSGGCFGGLWRGFNTKLCLEGGPGGGSWREGAPEPLENPKKTAVFRLPPNLGRPGHRGKIRVSGVFPLGISAFDASKADIPGPFLAVLRVPGFRRPFGGPNGPPKRGRKRGQILTKFWVQNEVKI